MTVPTPYVARRGGFYTPRDQTDMSTYPTRDDRRAWVIDALEHLTSRELDEVDQWLRNQPAAGRCDLTPEMLDEVDRIEGYE